MKVYYTVLFAAAVILCLLPLTAQAQTIKDLTLGETWMGETVNPAEIDGEVVAIEFWGYN